LKDKYENLVEKHYKIIKSRISPNQIDISDYIQERVKWEESIEYLKSFEFIDCEYVINKALKEGKNIFLRESEDFKLKSRETILERYGKEHFTKTEEYLEKTKS
jgi:hypothetical protein